MEATSGFDAYYSKWDKFDADAELERIEDESKKEDKLRSVQLDTKQQHKKEATTTAAMDQSTAVLSAKAKVAALRARAKRPGNKRLSAQEREAEKQRQHHAEQYAKLLAVQAKRSSELKTAMDSLFSARTKVPS